MSVAQVHVWSRPVIHIVFTHQCTHSQGIIVVFFLKFKFQCGEKNESQHTGFFFPNMVFGCFLIMQFGVHMHKTSPRYPRRRLVYLPDPHTYQPNMLELNYLSILHTIRVEYVSIRVRAYTQDPCIRLERKYDLCVSRIHFQTLNPL